MEHNPTNPSSGSQDEALEEIKAIEAETTSYYDQFSRYYLTRAKAVSRTHRVAIKFNDELICDSFCISSQKKVLKIGKYPHIDDFRQLVREIDEKQILEMRTYVNELKNNYASVYDLVFKNHEKIKKPKSNNISIMF